MSVSSISRTGTRTVFAGVHEDVDPVETKVRYPAATAGRRFIPRPQRPHDLRPELEKFTKPWHGSGRVYVSYKPLPADVRAGRWANYHRQAGDWLADHPNVVMIVHHEPEGAGDRLGGAAFAAMFNRSRDEIKSGWAGARVAYSAMAYQWRPNGVAGKNPAPWRQVDADEYLCDVYSGDSFPETAILPEHPGFTGWFDALVRPRLEAGRVVDWGLVERGFMAGRDSVRAATIHRESAWLTGVFDRFEATGSPVDLPPFLYVAWNTPGQERNPKWVLHDASLAAMRELTDAFARRTRG